MATRDRTINDKGMIITKYPCGVETWCECEHHWHKMGTWEKCCECEGVQTDAMKRVEKLHKSVPCGCSLGAPEIVCDEPVCEECGQEWPCWTLVVMWDPNADTETLEDD